MNHDDSTLTDFANTSIQPSMAIELQMIQQRKAAVAAELAEIDLKRQALEQEINDLAVTERTIARLMDITLPTSELPRALDVAHRRKPRDIPSVYVMAATLIRESRERGEHWLDASEIIKGIRERWWPTAEPGDISPTLWRLQKTQKLKKEGTRYALPVGKGHFDGLIGAEDQVVSPSLLTKQ